MFSSTGYVLVNMFFAIIAKHFQQEDKAVEERLERAAQVPGESQSMLEQCKAPAGMKHGV